MITNRINVQFIGRVGEYDVHLLSAKGLKRMIMTNIKDETVMCPETLIERKDLGSVDYNICVDIFQSFWTGQGKDENPHLNTIQWKHVGSTPDEVTMRAFVNRFGLSDVINFNDQKSKKDFAARTTVSALFIAKFNLDETGFLDDLNKEEEQPVVAKEENKGE